MSWLGCPIRTHQLRWVIEGCGIGVRQASVGVQGPWARRPGCQLCLELHGRCPATAGDPTGWDWQIWQEWLPTGWADHQGSERVTDNRDNHLESRNVCWLLSSFLLVCLFCSWLILVGTYWWFPRRFEPKPWAYTTHYKTIDSESGPNAKNKCFIFLSKHHLKQFVFFIWTLSVKNMNHFFV